MFGKIALAFPTLVLIAAIFLGIVIAKDYFKDRFSPKTASLNLESLTERSRVVTNEVFLEINGESRLVFFSSAMVYLFSDEYAIVPSKLLFIDTPLGTMLFSEAQQMFEGLTSKITIRANPDLDDGWKKEELEMEEIKYADTNMFIFKRTNPVFALDAPSFPVADFEKLSLNDDLYQASLSFNGAMLLNRASISGIFTNPNEGVKLIIFQGSTTESDFGGAIFKVNPKTNQPELVGIVFYALTETNGLAVDANKAKEIISQLK